MPPFVQNGSLLPLVEVRSASSQPRPSSSSEGIATLLKSPSNSPPEELTANSWQFLHLVKNKLHIEDLKQEPRCRDDRARSTSSSYASQGLPSPSPENSNSPPAASTLNFSDISKYGEPERGIFHLRSKSSLAEAPPCYRAKRLTDEATVEAEEAINGWQGEHQFRNGSYNQYELADSAEVLPSDSLSQRESPPRPSAFDTADRGQNRLERASGCHQPTRNHVDRISETFHGHAPHSPDPTPSPPQFLGNRTKRKASTFSLRSLTGSFAKRPRLGLRRLAADVYREGSRQLSQVRRKWRHQNEVEEREFAAWKANRRKARPADPLKGKTERGYGTFSFERGRYGNEGWWVEGVKRYQAPEWMAFASFENPLQSK